MNRKQYRKIAKKYGVTVQEVKQGINEVINYAYKNPNNHTVEIPRQGETPTADELINHLVGEVKKKM